MQITHIDYRVANNKMQMSEFIGAGVLQKSEAVIMEKMMGLKIIPRDHAVTQYDRVDLLMKKLLSALTLDPLKVKYIFLSHTAEQIAPISIPHFSNRMRQLGFRHAIAFGSTLNKCATPFHYIEIASILLQSMAEDECIILIQSDCAFTPILQSIPGSTVMGDAGSVVVLSKKQDEHRIVDVLLEVDPRFHHGVFAERSENMLFQQIYIQKLSDLMIKITQKNQISLSELALILPHNVNLLSWKAVAKTINFPIEKLFLQNIPVMAHCFGSDPFINLKDALQQNRLKKQDYYLLTTVGLGATFAVMLCQY
jgi:3-oxoacyl-[acyl-carrier-protein] synthase-3